MENNAQICLQRNVANIYEPEQSLQIKTSVFIITSAKSVFLSSQITHTLSIGERAGQPRFGRYPMRKTTAADETRQITFSGSVSLQ